MYKIDINEEELNILVDELDKKARNDRTTDTKVFGILNRLTKAKPDMRDTCWNCGGKLVWQCDYDFDDYGVEWYDDDNGNKIDGIVQVLHCSNCFAEVEYKVPCFDKKEEKK